MQRTDFAKLGFNGPDADPQNAATPGGFQNSNARRLGSLDAWRRSGQRRALAIQLDTRPALPGFGECSFSRGLQLRMHLRCVEMVFRRAVDGDDAQ